MPVNPGRPTILRSYVIVPGAAAMRLDDQYLDAGVLVFCGDSIVLASSLNEANNLVAALGAASGIGIKGPIGPLAGLVGVWAASTSKLASDLIVVMGPGAE